MELTPVIPTCGRLRQEDCFEFEISLSYRVRLYLEHKQNKNKNHYILSSQRKLHFSIINSTS